MRALMVAVLCVSAAACTFDITPCTTNDQCGEGNECVENFCTKKSDGGTTGGGGGGGGTGGGGAADCPSGCMDWQTCQPGNGGTCRNAAVAIMSPAPQSLFAGASSARVVARVTDWDGGAFPRASIPASGSTGVTAPTMMKDDAGLFVGDFGLPNVAGTHTLTAGWPATNATVEVLTQVCSMMCADWEECLPSADGGTCSDLGLTLSWDMPVDDFKYAPNTSVDLSLQVTRADGGGFSKPVPFTVSGGTAGTLMLNGSWIGTVPSGTVDARRTLEAGWSDGGPTHAIRHFLVDATPPVLGLVVESDGGAFQRDAVVSAVLVSNEGVTDAGLSLGGVVMPRVADSACPNLASVDGGVACFQLDFSQPALNGLDGGFVATLSATDQYTNSGPGTGGVLPVTRVRWVATPTTHQVQALAVGPDGTLYGGTATNGSELFKILPTGDAGTPVALGEIQSLAVAAGASTDDVVYVAYNTSVPAVRGFIGAVESSSLGTGGLFPACPGANGSKTYSGIALYRSSSETFAVGSVNSVTAVGGRGCLYGPSTGVTPFGSTTQFDSAVVSATGPTVATNVVVSGSTASFLRQDTAGAWWQPATLSGTSTPTIGTASQLTALAVAPSLGQAITGSEFLISTVNSGNGKQLFGRPTAVEGNLGANNDKGVPVLASSSEGYLGIGDALVRFSPADLNNHVPVGTVPSGDSIRTSPVLGAPRVSGGMAEGYAVSRSGTLLAFRQGVGVELWRAPLLGPGDAVNTHMAFDCNRANPTSKTGVLYVGAASGKVLSIIIDAPKLLDSSGAWPKYQRSMGNAGNDDTTNFPTNWPACP